MLTVSNSGDANKFSFVKLLIKIAQTIVSDWFELLAFASCFDGFHYNNNCKIIDSESNLAHIP